MAITHDDSATPLRQRAAAVKISFDSIDTFALFEP
jgi:hypothetical protein